MQYTLFNFLSSALIPELRADVSAGAARDIHFVLIGVSAVRTFPNEFSVGVLFNFDLAVISADVAEVALCIKLRIHYMIIDKFHYRNYSVNIVLHIRNFNIRNCSSG